MLNKLIMAAVFLLLGTIAASAGEIKVIDGDSIRIGRREIRLAGIDAPEYHQECFDERNRPYQCGQKSLQVLREMVDESMECRKLTTDRYHREIAVCYVQGEDINRKMVQSGWAVAYDFDRHDYDEDEKLARQAHKGIWSGRFMRPELYRALHR